MVVDVITGGSEKYFGGLKSKVKVQQDVEGLFNTVNVEQNSGGVVRLASRQGWNRK